MARSKQQPVGRAVHNSNVSGMQAGHNRLHKQRAIDEGANKPKTTKTQAPTIKHLKKNWKTYCIEESRKPRYLAADPQEEVPNPWFT